MLWTRNLAVIPNYARSFDFPQKIFTIMITSSDFADDVFRIGVYGEFLETPEKIFTVT